MRSEAKATTPAQVLAAARSGNPGVMFCFWGPERYLLSLTVKRLAECLPAATRPFNYRMVEGGWQNPAADLLDWAYSSPVGAPWRLLVVREEELLASGKGSRRGDEEAYLAYLSRPAAGCCVVLLGGAAVDTRGPLYRRLAQAKAVVSFAPLGAGELRRWAGEEASSYGKSIEPRALSYLVTISAGDLGFLLGAVAKSCLYVGSSKEVNLDAVQEVVSTTPQGSIFNLVDAVGERNTAKALVFLRHLLESGEPPLRIAFMLTRQIRLILQAKLLVVKGKKAAEIAQALEVPPFVADKIVAQARDFSFGRLAEALEQMLAVDGMLKGGNSDPALVLECGILSICKPAV